MVAHCRAWSFDMGAIQRGVVERGGPATSVGIASLRHHLYDVESWGWRVDGASLSLGMGEHGQTIDANHHATG